MRAEVLMPLALLFIAQGVPSSAQSEGAGAGEPSSTAAAPPAERAAAADAAGAAPLFYYDVGRSFSLNCTEARADSQDGYVWTVNGTALEKVAALEKRHELAHGRTVLTVKARTQEDDFGKYACAAGGATQTWEVRGKPHAKLAPNTNVVEGQKLKLVCKLTGKPYPAVSWTYNVTEGNVSDVSVALHGRVKLQPNEQGVEGAQLVLEEAARDDAGQYTCQPAGGAAAATVLRVKGMYAALWPFLGICAEVFVLCAIILVYEKRRTKPELDDSDTDNHDQKKS